jgi:hypothetical protein
MNKPQLITRYNQRNPAMRARELTRKSSSLRLAWLTSFLLATTFLPSSLSATTLGDTARQLAHKIAAASGSGAFALEVVNRSSLDDKSVRDVRSALEAELQVEGVHPAPPQQAMGTVEVILSESLREYVWTAEIVTGSAGNNDRNVVLVSLPRSPTTTPIATALPIVLKANALFSQEQPILDVALIDMPGESRLLVLGHNAVSIYHHPAMNGNSSGNSIGRWQLDVSLPIAHARTFPRDLRGRLLLRRDHLVDVFLPGVRCRSSATAPLTLACEDTDDPWPLTPEDMSVRAFYAAARNFFTGALSPAIGKISNVPSFYSAAAFPRPNYTLWAFAAVDGSLHLVDGMTDQSILVAKSTRGSDLAAVHSNCGSGTQLLLSENGDSEGDGLRAFEIPDRDIMPASPALEFEGQGLITALWPESSGNSAVAIVRRKDTGWYEAYRISISCGN